MKASAAVAQPLANSAADAELQQNWNDQTIVGRRPVNLVTRAQSRFAPSALSRIANKVPSTADVDVQPSNKSPVRNSSSVVVNVPTLFKTRKIGGRSLNTLQEWEGLVTKIGGDSFSCRLRDLTYKSSNEELAEIPFEEIDVSDRNNLQLGAVFHLIVGYTKRSGSQRRETMIYFRRHLPKAKSNGLRLLNLLKATRGDID